MRQVILVPHQLKYAKEMSILSSTPQVKDALGLEEEHTTLEGTIDFIEFIIEQEKLGKQYSRCILNEDEKLIGVITLKDIDRVNRICHIGTWIGQDRKSTRLNSSHVASSYAVFCLKKEKPI